MFIGSASTSRRLFFARPTCKFCQILSCQMNMREFTVLNVFIFKSHSMKIADFVIGSFLELQALTTFCFFISCSILDLVVYQRVPTVPEIILHALLCFLKPEVTCLFFCKRVNLLARDYQRCVQNLPSRPSLAPKNPVSHV